MNATKIGDVTIENVAIKKLAIFDGYEINFMMENQYFQFLVGNSKSSFPLNVKHIFKEKEICKRCKKMTYQAPIGQQICHAFTSELKELLAYFQESYPEKFK